MQSGDSVTFASTDDGLIGFTLNHAYLVYDSSGKYHMASNPVSLRLQ